MMRRIEKGKRIKKIGVLVVLGIFMATMVISVPAAADPDYDWETDGTDVWTGHGTGGYPGGNVGIGRASPGAKLEVAGSGHSIKLTDSGDSYNLRAIIGHSDGNGGYLTLYDDNENPKIVLSSYDDCIFKRSKVGIGALWTGSPQTTLHVGTEGADNHIRLNRYGWAAYMDIISGGAFGAINCADTINEVFQIQEDGTPRLHIKKGGNVGIGTTSPSHSLHVVTSSTQYSAIYAQTSSTSPPGQNQAAIEGYLDTTSGHPIYGAFGVFGHSEREYGVYGLTGGACSTHSRAGVCGAVGTNAYGSAGILGLDDEALKGDAPVQPTSRTWAGYFKGGVRIVDGSGAGDLIISDGNVGIGTLSPGSRLVVKGSGYDSATSAFHVTDSLGMSILKVRDDGKITIGTPNPLWPWPAVLDIEKTHDGSSVMWGEWIFVENIDRVSDNMLIGGLNVMATDSTEITNNDVELWGLSAHAIANYNNVDTTCAIFADAYGGQVHNWALYGIGDGYYNGQVLIGDVGVPFELGTAQFSVMGGNVGIGTMNPQEKLILGSNSNFAIEMATPTGVTATPTSGGTLSAGTYFYRVVAVDGVGSTIGSDEVSANVDGIHTNAVTISWAAVTGASSYRVYGRFSPQNQYWETTSLSYIDTGTAGTSGVVPTVTTAYLTKLSGSSNSWVLDGNVGIGTANPVVKLVINDGWWASMSFQDDDTGQGLWQGLMMGIDMEEDGFIWNYEDKDLYFGTNDIERVRIRNNGNVGIGYNELSQTAKLAVNGNVGIGVYSTVEKLEVDGRISITGDPNSGDDVMNRDYADTRYINVGESGGSLQDDSLDFDKFEDTMDLDATTEINLGGHDLNIDLSGTGDFKILDGGTTEHIFRDDGKVGIGTGNPSSNADLTVDNVLKLVPRADPPSTGEYGMIYMDTDGMLYFYGKHPIYQVDMWLACFTYDT